MSTAIKARDRLLRGYVDAFAPAAAARAVVAAEIAEAVASRRRELSWDEAIETALDLHPRRLRLETEPTPAVGADVVIADRDHGFWVPRLTEASFESILGEIVRWRAEVEKYPEAFRAPDEEARTSVLAATLACLFGDATRETFCYGGYSGLYVPVAGLRAVSGAPFDPNEPHYFLAEAKRGTGQELARGVAAQAERYRTARVRRVTLLFYVEVDRGSVQAAVDRTLVALRAAPGWAEQPAGPGDPDRVHRFLVLGVVGMPDRTVVAVFVDTALPRHKRSGVA